MVGAPPMCRLLFRGNAPARTGKDAFEDADMIKPGDPVDAFPDEHVFGKEEVAPLFVIVDVPDMTVDEGRMLCAPMRKPLDAFGNLDRLKPIALVRSFGAAVTDLKRTMTRAELLGALVQKQPVASPLAIGTGPEVIG